MNFNGTKAKTALSTPVSSQRPLDAGLGQTADGSPQGCEKELRRCRRGGRGGVAGGAVPVHGTAAASPAGTPTCTPRLAPRTDGPLQLHADQNSPQHSGNWEYAGYFLFFLGTLGTQE